jgi:hypothetical protein
VQFLEVSLSGAAGVAGRVCRAEHECALGEATSAKSPKRSGSEGGQRKTGCCRILLLRTDSQFG